MRLGAAGVVGRRRLERCASQSLYPLDGTHDRYSRADLAISLHFPPAVGPHRFSNSPTVGLEPTTTRLRALRSADWAFERSIFRCQQRFMSLILLIIGFGKSLRPELLTTRLQRI